jgi:hypothetical protein
MKVALPAAYLTLSLIALAIVVARPSGPFVLIVTAPAAEASGSMAVIDRAEGAFVWAGRVPWISVAYSPAPDFPERLRQAGALLVINHGLAYGCLQGMDT